MPDDKTPANLVPTARAVGKLFELIGTSVERVNSYVAKPGSAAMQLGAAIKTSASDVQSQKVIDDIQRAIEAGLDPTRMQTAEYHTILAEWLNDLETELPDPRRHKLLRKVMVAAAFGIEGDKDSTKALLFTKTARSLSGAEALMVGCLARCRKPSQQVTEKNPHQRRKLITKLVKGELGVQSGIPYPQQIERLLVSLRDKGITNHNDSEVVWANDKLGMLTDYGSDFCAFLKKGEI